MSDTITVTALLAGYAGLFVAAGVLTSGSAAARWALLAAIAAGAVAMFLALLLQRDAMLTGDERAVAVVICTAAVTLPALGYVWLGDALRRRPWLAVAATVATTPLLVGAAFVAFLALWGLSCPADAYEC
jgi:ABC-type amino acid transport system permease subunit